MQRLLDDAEKLPDALGRKFDISNYADIVEAIHLVQDEMGITGTTAAEAGKTISGSIASAKAAWENLVTGLADENADLDTLIGNVVDSVVTAGDNLLPRVEKILGGIGSLVSKMAPIIAERLPGVVAAVGPPLIAAGTQLLVSLAQGILTAAPQLASALVETIPTLIESLQENAPQLMEAGSALLDYIGDGIMQGIPLLAGIAFDLLTNLGTYLQENLPTLLANALPLLVQFTESLRENAGVLVDGALALIQSLAQGLVDSLPTLIENVPLIISNIANIINDNAPKMLESAFHILVTLGQGLIAAIPTLIANIPQILQAVADVITAFDWINLGGNIIKSLGSGIKAMAGGLKEFVTKGFTGAIEFIKGLPAKALQWGKDFIGGLIKGITGSIGGVLNAVKNIGSTIASYLHFSRPDVGPLRDYETWMPDMMAGLAAGIERGRGMVIDALDTLTEGMEQAVSSISPGFGADGIMAVNSSAGANRPMPERPVTININIDGAKYQDVNELAQAVADILYRLFSRKVSAYA